MKLEDILSKSAIREFKIVESFGLHSHHPLDRERFRRFVCACHRMGKKKKIIFIT